MSLSRVAIRALVLAVMVVFLAGVAHAQYRAAIQGVVSDPQGAVVDGATLTLTAKETNISKTTTSNSSGVYVFSSLAPGRYSLVIEKTGFKKQVLDDVLVSAEQTIAVNVQMQVGQIAETVKVTSEVVPLVDTETASVSGTVTTKEIEDMPSFGRDVFQLLQLAPGAFGDGAQSAGGGTYSLPGSNSAGPGATDGIFKTENAPQIIANGTTLNANNITIDGVGVTSVSWGGAAVVTPNEESVKEVRVLTNSYDAENGRYSGAQIQVISQNGTNQFHGSAFFKLDRPGLNAYQRWNGPFAGTAGLQRDDARFNQWGGSFGGPIWKNKIFGFFSYETIRNSGTSVGSGWYETPQFDALAASGSIASKFLTYPGEGAKFTSIQPITCTAIGLSEGVNCNTIAGEGLNVGSPLPYSAGTLDPSYVSSGNPGIGSGLSDVPDIMLANTVSPSSSTEEQYNGRIDFNATNKDLVAFSLYRVPLSSTFFNGPNRSANLWHHSSTNEAETALWTHTFSSTLLNEARMNAAGWRWNEINTNSQEPWGLPQDSLDCFGTACLNFFGAPGPSVFDQWTYNVKDVLSKVHNSHMLKFGGELTRLLFVDEAPWSARPSYSFRNLWDFLNDAPYSEGGNFNPLTGAPTLDRKDTRENIIGLFAQDNYKFRPNLTFNLGLRWEYFGPLHDKNGHLSSVDLGTGADALTGLSLREGGNLYTAQKGNFGPQLGFAWSPRRAFGHDFQSRFVVRGGFGIGYTGLEEAISLNGRDNPPLVDSPFFCCSTTQTLPSIVYAVPSDIHSFGPYPANPDAITTFNSSNLPVSGAPVGVTGFPAHLPTMYTDRYSLDLQYDLGHNWVATLGYQGSSSHHLTRQYNANIVYAAQGIAMNPMVSSVDWYANDANANFNAMLAGLRHQFAQSFQLEAQYRWSKSLDDASQPYYEDPYPYNPQQAWGKSDFNATNSFKLFGIWSPKIFRGSQNWMEKVVGGWSLSGILNAHSGFPWTPMYSNGINCNLIYQGSGFCSLRPAAYLGGAGTDHSNSAFESGPNPSNSAAYNANFPKGALAYFTIPTFTQGPAFPGEGPIPQGSTVPRNFLTGPNYFDVDAGLNKSFGLPRIPFLGEGAKFEIRADFFNLFNKLNLNPGSIDNIISTDGVTSNPAFGQAQSALGSRTIEIQLRFSF